MKQNLQRQSVQDDIINKLTNLKLVLSGVVDELLEIEPKLKKLHMDQHIIPRDKK
jgi:hypothetical protein